MTTQYDDPNMTINRHDIAHNEMVSDFLKNDFIQKKTTSLSMEISIHSIKVPWILRLMLMIQING